MRFLALFVALFLPFSAFAIVYQEPFEIGYNGADSFSFSGPTGGSQFRIQYASAISNFGAPITKIEFPLHDDFNDSTLDFTCNGNPALDTVVDLEYTGVSVEVATGIFFDVYEAEIIGKFDPACGTYTSEDITTVNYTATDSGATFPYNNYFRNINYTTNSFPITFYTGGDLVVNSSPFGTSTPGSIISSVTNGVQDTAGSALPIALPLVGVPLTFVIARYVIRFISLSA